jgi:hypothetical protein
MSSLLSQLGQGHIVTGTVTASDGTDAALTSNDGSASLARTATGDYTVTFGQAFLSAPTVVANTIDAAQATTAGHIVTIQTVTTTDVGFDVLTLSQAAGTSATDLAALADIDFSFMAFGLRDL